MRYGISVLLYRNGDDTQLEGHAGLPGIKTAECTTQKIVEVTRHIDNFTSTKPFKP